MFSIPFSITRIVAIALISVSAACAQTANPPAVETIASYPHGQFLENLDTAPDGSVLLTSYMDRTILRWNNGGAVQPLVTLTVHPAGVLAQGDRIVITAHGTSFMEGPAFTRTNQILVLDRTGKVVRQTAVPDALFLNGLVALDADHILAADSLAGTIWLFRPSTGAVTAWLKDPMLTTDPASTDQRPGANGLKRRGDWLYISNSSRGAVHRVRLAGLWPEGALTEFARTGPVDDFTFLADGSIAAATHGARLIRIGTNGQVSDILSSGCDACTSVASVGDGALLVTTSGNLLEGGSAPARLLRIAPPATR